MNTQIKTSVLPLAAKPWYMKLHSVLALLQQPNPGEPISGEKSSSYVGEKEFASHSMHDNDGRLTHIYVTEGLYKYELGNHAQTV